MTPARLPSRRGFTLIELLVASIVGAMLAAATASAVSMLVRAKGASAARGEAYARAQAAATRIERDLWSTVRDDDLVQARVMVENGGDGPVQRDELLILTRSMEIVRGEEDSPEGPEFEVQYRVQARGERDATPALWRRVDPAFDGTQDGGGVATPIVPGVQSLSVEASDGQEWYPAWDSDTDGFPHGLRITVVARSDDGRAEATARRIIALDRTPPPREPPPSDDEQDQSKKNQNQAQNPQNQGASGTNPSNGYTRTLPGGPGGQRPPGAGGGQPGGGNRGGDRGPGNGGGGGRERGGGNTGGNGGGPPAGGGNGGGRPAGGGPGAGGGGGAGRGGGR